MPNTPEGRAAFETLNPAPAAAPGAPGSGLPGDMTSSATGGFNPWMFNAQMDEAKRRNDLANATAQGSQESGFVIIDGKPVSWQNYSRGYDDEGNAIGTSKAGFQAGPDMFVVNGLDNTGANLGANQGAFVFQPRPGWQDSGQGAVRDYLGSEISVQPFAGSQGAPMNLADPFGTPNRGSGGGQIVPLDSLNAAKRAGDAPGTIAAIQAGRGLFPTGTTGSRVDVPNGTRTYGGAQPRGSYSGIPDAVAAQIAVGETGRVNTGAAGDFTVTEEMILGGFVPVDAEGKPLPVGTVVKAGSTVDLYHLTPQEVALYRFALLRAKIPGGDPSELVDDPSGVGDYGEYVPGGGTTTGTAGITAESFMAALAGQESGDPTAENPDSGAYGAWQIMPANWPSWSKAAGLGDNAPQTAENQRIVVAYKLKEYYDTYGDWADVAAVWYSGSPMDAYTDAELDAPQYSNGNRYPSIREYVNSVVGAAGGSAAPSAPAATATTVQQPPGAGDFGELVPGGVFPPSTSSRKNTSQDIVPLGVDQFPKPPKGYKSPNVEDRRPPAQPGKEFGKMMWEITPQMVSNINAMPDAQRLAYWKRNPDAAARFRSAGYVIYDDGAVEFTGGAGDYGERF